MSERGKFIVFEGPGGGGKTTQIQLARPYLEEQDIQHLISREPGGFDATEQIRELIFKSVELGIATPEQQVALFMASRYLWMNEIVIPTLNSGVHLITDRSFVSTAAYQSYAEGASLENVENWSRFVTGDYMPNAVFLLDISPETVVARKAADNGGDPFDQKAIDYTERVVNGYRDMAQRSWMNLNWFIFDAEKPIDELQNEIREALTEILNYKKVY